MTKENYEREKARKEMRGEIRQARDFSKEAESIHALLFLGACMILKPEANTGAALDKASSLFVQSKARAAEMAKVKHPFDEISPTQED